MLSTTFPEELLLAEAGSLAARRLHCFRVAEKHVRDLQASFRGPICRGEGNTPKGRHA